MVHTGLPSKHQRAIQENLPRAFTPLEENDYTHPQAWSDHYQPKEALKVCAPPVNASETEEFPSLMSVKSDVVPQKPSHKKDVPKQSKPLSKGFRSLEVLLLLFGFNFLSGKQPSRKALLYLVPLRLLLSIYIAHSVWVIIGCAISTKKYTVDPGCATNQYLANSIDIVFVTACFIALLCHGSTLRVLLHVAVDEAHKSGMPHNVRRLTTVSVCFALMSLALSVSAQAGISNTDLAKLYFSFKIKTFITALFPFFLRLFGSLVISTISTIFVSTSYSLNGLKLALENGTLADAKDIDEHCRKMVQLVNHVDACFSGLLPVILGALLANLFVMLNFVTGKNMPPTIYLHGLCTVWDIWLLLILILPALMVNAKLKSTFSVTPPEVQGDHTYLAGIFLPNSPLTADVNQVMFHHQSRLPILTAGGIPISTWFIVSAAFGFALFYWIRVELNSLYEPLAKSISKLAKAKG